MVTLSLGTSTLLVLFVCLFDPTLIYFSLYVCRNLEALKFAIWFLRRLTTQLCFFVFQFGFCVCILYFYFSILLFFYLTKMVTGSTNKFQSECESWCVHCYLIVHKIIYTYPLFYLTQSLILLVSGLACVWCVCGVSPPHT